MTVIRYKDPQAVKNFLFDLAPQWLAEGDTIATVTVEEDESAGTPCIPYTVDPPPLEPDPLTISVLSNTDTTFTVQLAAGGTPGVGYPFPIHYASASGSEDDETLIVIVQQQ